MRSQIGKIGGFARTCILARLSPTFGPAFGLATVDSTVTVGFIGKTAEIFEPSTGTPYDERNLSRSRVPARMKHDRLVPIIVAVALFMDNMDSTVIATSLPAIAADIGTSPLTLKLAVTSYLLSLAVFIPMSGWTADRFGARTVFRAAIARVRAGLDRLRAVGLDRAIRAGPHRPGHGRRDDDAGRPAGAGAHHRPARAGQCHGLGVDPGDDRPADGAAARRLHHHLRDRGTGSSSSTCRSG